MDDSWVVEDDSISWNESSESPDSDTEPKAARSKMRKQTKNTANADSLKATNMPLPESRAPELVMPSLTSSILPAERPAHRRKHPVPSRATPKPVPNQRPERVSQRKLELISDENSTTSQLADKMILVLVSLAEGFLDILGQTLKSLKRPISWLLAVYLFAGIILLVQNLLTTSIYTALSPICRIPGVSFLNLPLCQYVSPNNDNPSLPPGTSAPVEFEALMKTQSQFEEILSESAAGVSLPLDMKRSETSIRDLRQIVRYSKLSSRNEMVLEFDGFIESARIASYDLQKFNSHIGRGVDIVLSTARWTQHILDDMEVKKASRGMVPAFIQDKLLAPFTPMEFTEARLLDQYISHTRIVSDEIERLIDEAQALLLVLQNLEDRLEVIDEIAMHDNVAAKEGKDEILSHLWTILGGNRAQLGKYNSQLTLLRQVGRYRKVAWAHISATILKLQAMGAELEELRTRVGSAEVLRDSSKHQEIPLRVHIESIRLGVQRLEEGRERARRLEQNHVRRVIDGAEGEGPMALGEV